MTIGLALLEAMRPKQWVKNVLLLIGLVFALKLADPLAVSRAAAAFVVFCALASAGYLFNDLADVEQDRQHPRKRLRPLASGRIGRAHTVGLGSVLLVFALAIAFALSLRFGLVVVGYVALTIAYNGWLKHLVLLDAFALASFYLVRAVAGAVAIDVPISPWLYLCIGLGALFLGLAKRRHELLLLGVGAASHRRILREYTPALVEQLITIVTASLIMAYSLYTFSAENLPRNHTMMLTIPLVVYGVLRYLYLMHRREAGGSPEETLLRDIPLLITVLALGGVAVLVLYWRG
jgi:4-hydroxybenzoate polyprenyltransferase